MDPKTYVATGSDDGLAKVWAYSNEQGEMRVECKATLFGHNAGITSIAWNPRDLDEHIFDVSRMGNPEDDQLLTSSKDQTLKIWQPFAKHGPTHRTVPEPVRLDADDIHRQNAKPVNKFKHGDYINMACWRPDRVDKGKQEDVHDHNSKVSHLQQVLSCSDDGTAAIWDVYSGELKHRLKAEGVGHSAAVSMATWSPDGGRVLTCSQDHSCIIWSAKTGRNIKLLPAQPTKDKWKQHWGPIWSAMFSGDGHEVVTASKDGTARTWDCNTGQCITVLHDQKCESSGAFSVSVGVKDHPTTHSDIVFGACFNPFEGTQILTCSMDGTAKVWDKRDRRVTLLIDRHQGAVWSACFGNEPNSGGRMILTSSHDMSALVYDQRLGMPKNHLEGHTGILWQASFSEDDQRVVTCSEDRSAILWDLSTGERRPPRVQLMDPVYPHKQAVTCAAFRPPSMLPELEKGREGRRISTI